MLQIIAALLYPECHSDNGFCGCHSNGDTDETCRKLEVFIRQTHVGSFDVPGNVLKILRQVVFTGMSFGWGRP